MSMRIWGRTECHRSAMKGVNSEQLLFFGPGSVHVEIVDLHSDSIAFYARFPCVVWTVKSCVPVVLIVF